VIDTNVFVAAGFNPRSRAARLVEAVRDGRITLVYDEATRRETRRVLSRIPRLDFADVAELFRPENAHEGPTEPERFDRVPDPADRKFLALADAAGALLVSNDSDLLDHSEQSRARVMSASACARELGLGG